MRLVGCTTAGEITPQGYGRGCVSAVGFDHRSFSIAAARIDALDSFSLLDAQQVVAQLVEECRGSRLRADHRAQLRPDPARRPVQPRGTGARALNAAFGRIPHFGGSAGDDNHLTRTHVYHDGRFHTGAAVVVLVHTALDFEVFTTHHIQPRDEKLVVTAADPVIARSSS